MIFVLLCLLAGCVTQSVAPADIYTISPEWGDRRTRAEREKKSHLIIKLAPVRATQALTGTEIIYTDARHSRNSYAHSRWSDAPVRLLQTLFQVALEENGRFGAVVPPPPLQKPICFWKALCLISVTISIMTELPMESSGCVFIS